MSYALNNTTTADAYGSCVLSCKGTVKVNISVANAAVLYTPTFRDVAGTTSSGAETYLAPGFYSLRRPIDSLTFRSAVTGIPAQVTIEALLLKESNQ